jgi:pyruvate dehydrogenase E1 component
VFFQPHSAPGVYARAFLEGRLTENDLAHYRQEITAPAAGARGLSSYPHPWLMPDFWQFPTGSMGIGPISSIYHARFMRYLTHRNQLDCEGRKVWGVFGDGEMDEPESMSALTLASREKLDNLVWVVNCNLQRLDGPVRGNGRIVDELEKLFRGAGWNVIKLLWGSDWDGLFARDTTGALVKAFAHTVDGQMQTFAAKDGRFNRDTLLRPERGAGAPGAGHDRRTDRPPEARRPRPGEDPRGLRRGGPAPRPADRDPGPHQEGLRHGRGRPGQDDHAQPEEAGRIGAAGIPQPLQPAAVRRTGEEPGLLQARRGQRRDALPARAPQALGGYMPQRQTQCAVVPVPDAASYAQFALPPAARRCRPPWPSCGCSARC